MRQERVGRPGRPHCGQRLSKAQPGGKSCFAPTVLHVSGLGGTQGSSMTGQCQEPLAGSQALP